VRGVNLSSSCSSGSERSDPAATDFRSRLGVTGTCCEDPRGTKLRRGELGGLEEEVWFGEVDIALPWMGRSQGGSEGAKGSENTSHMEDSTTVR
jgi:hypothetical protein